MLFLLQVLAHLQLSLRSRESAFGVWISLLIRLLRSLTLVCSLTDQVLWHEERVEEGVRVEEHFVLVELKLLLLEALKEHLSRQCLALDCILRLVLVL